MYSTIISFPKVEGSASFQYNTDVNWIMPRESATPASGQVRGRAGRVRDADIDARILSVAGRHLSRHGYQGMSLAAVAEEAGTTRQALYRRWAGKAELAAAVVASIGDEQDAGVDAGIDPFAALVAELADFERGVSRPGRMSLVGTMLQETTDPEVAERYRAHVIAPRRRRLLAVFEEAVRRGLIDQDADLTVALTMCTGSWYGRALAGADVPSQWPLRAATLVWRALGGSPPVDASAGPGAGTAADRTARQADENEA
jgi:AcrR family transcriptional regulator